MKNPQKSPAFLKKQRNKMADRITCDIRVEFLILSVLHFLTYLKCQALDVFFFFFFVALLSLQYNKVKWVKRKYILSYQEDFLILM